MTDQVRAAVFICREHGASPLVLRALLKDPRVGHSQVLPSCCAREGRDQIDLFLRGRTVDALLVAGCLARNAGAFREIAVASGIPATRVAVVPAAACRTPKAAELALSRVLDPRIPSTSPERREGGLVIIGSGEAAEAALEQADAQGMAVTSLTVEETLADGSRVLGGPGAFTLEAGEAMHSFGAVLLALDDEVRVRRDRLCDRPGTAVLLAGVERLSDEALAELGSALRAGGPAYLVAKETPFPGQDELVYRELQSKGMRFIRASDATVTADGVLVRDEHLGQEVLLDVGTVVLVERVRTEASPLLRLFGLPSKRSFAGAIPGCSGMPGVHVAGSSLTSFEGRPATDAARAAVMMIDRELRAPVSPTPLARVNEGKCSLCLNCLRICPYGAPAVRGEKMAISLERCQGCGLCLAICPSDAIEMPPADMRGEIGSTTMGPRGSSP